MLRISLVALIGLFFTFTARGDDKKDQAPFQGKWKVVSIEIDGEKVDTANFEKAVLTVTGDVRVLKEGDEVKSKATYKVDATKSPKTIDLDISEGGLKGRSLKGIYEFKGDTVTINVALQGENRPKDFTSKEGSGHLLQTFKKMADK